ncbi:hypothetical protein [Halomonas sp. AOP43-D1-4]|uniref:hypothetical protein n=1 Tax=Halomonas sp. AOP43-D1-4 TaxID=3457658 RepID=UPI004034AD3A
MSDSLVIALGRLVGFRWRWLKNLVELFFKGHGWSHPGVHISVLFIGGVVGVVVTPLALDAVGVVVPIAVTRLVSPAAPICPLVYSE